MEEIGSDESEAQHKVTISKPFYLQTTQVTQGKWKSLMGYNPSEFKDCGDSCPVENVSWFDALEFISMLNVKENTDKYRLPTEAEWEYACRAGRSTRFCFGDSEDQLGEYAWYDANSKGKTHPVGGKNPMPGVSTTCTATSMNGVRIGMEIIPPATLPTL